MAYSDFTLTDLERKFKIGSQKVDLFDKKPLVMRHKELINKDLKILN